MKAIAYYVLKTTIFLEGEDAKVYGIAYFDREGDIVGMENLFTEKRTAENVCCYLNQGEIALDQLTSCLEDFIL